MAIGPFKLDGRGILKGTLAGAAAMAPLTDPQAQTLASIPAPGQRDWTSPSAAPDPGSMTQVNSGSDFMVDVFKGIGFEYLAANPGTSFRGLHESTVALLQQ